MTPPIRWHLITGEYPPQPGGVSDYSRVVARGLAAAGDTVQVYAPAIEQTDPHDGGVFVRRLTGGFGPRGLAQLSHSIYRLADDRLLVQYVPHAFGFKAMNLLFCQWLYAHARKNGRATLMFHEVQLGVLPGDPMRYRVIDAVTRVMAMFAARSASRVFVSTPIWESHLRRYIPGNRPIVWMPVPSTIAVISDRARVDAARRRWEHTGRAVIGHFGTYTPAIATMLRAIVPLVLATDSSAEILLIGANGSAFRDAFVSASPKLAPRISATGMLPDDELSLAISSCDLMMQPYPDGVSSRRTTMMAALDHARAIVTTAGAFTEPLWKQSGATAMVPAEDSAAFAAAVIELSADTGRRSRYGAAAKALYLSRFDVRHTIEALRAPSCA
jgi:glycosyltransferase involved in cell wall biosynthesis